MLSLDNLEKFKSAVTEQAIRDKNGIVKDFINKKSILDEINKSGIGPAGLGGRNTALAINIETYATHIAGLPVAVNICCHVNRHCEREI